MQGHQHGHMLRDPVTVKVNPMHVHHVDRFRRERSIDRLLKPELNSSPCLRVQHTVRHRHAEQLARDFGPGVRRDDGLKASSH
jgi:hypothetical protein